MLYNLDLAVFRSNECDPRWMYLEEVFEARSEAKPLPDAFPVDDGVIHR